MPPLQSHLHVIFYILFQEGGLLPEVLVHVLPGVRGHHPLPHHHLRRRGALRPTYHVLPRHTRLHEGN